MLHVHYVELPKEEPVLLQPRLSQRQRNFTSLVGTKLQSDHGIAKNIWWARDQTAILNFLISFENNVKRKN